MKRLSRTSRSLPSWLLSHFGRSDPVLTNLLDEMVEDYAQLMEAIAYWEDRSPQKVAEFTDLAAEIENEMKQLVAAMTTGKQIRRSKQ